jgi:hypothetical protein
MAVPCAVTEYELIPKMAEATPTPPKKTNMEIAAFIAG